MVKISEFGENFLLLALRINKHIDGYIDFYIGPENLKQLVKNESIISPNKLLQQCEVLQKNLSTQGYDKQRESYVGKHILAMRTSIEDLIGIEIPFKDKFMRLYDVELQPINESELYNLLDDFNEAYKGSGSLNDRIKVLRERRKIPEEKVFLFFKKALNITKMRTIELFGDLLPKKEEIIIELVEDKNINEANWSYYEWYLGNYLSRIDVNPKFNIYWTTILSSAAHEGYPGHHTNFTINEQKLFLDLNQFEYSILLLHSPKLVICEGIADIAIDILYSFEEQAEISLQFKTYSTPEINIDILAKQNKLKTTQSLFYYVLAYHALFDEWSKEKLIRYANDLEIIGQKNISNTLNLISDPTHSTTVFLYHLGVKLIKNKYGKIPSVTNFRNLLENPFLPSDLK